MRNIEPIKKAREINKKYNPNYISPFPFDDLDKGEKDLELYEADFNDIDKSFNDNISGFISKDDGISKIYINKNRPKNRQYFTLAHELGHFFLHKEQLEKKGEILDIDNVLFRQDGTYFSSKEEMEANFFAAELIMPQLKVRPVFELFNFSIQDTANYFCVSISAMSIRLDYLDLLNRYY